MNVRLPYWRRTMRLMLLMFAVGCLPGLVLAQAPDTVFLEELTWTEVRDVLAAGTTTVMRQDFDALTDVRAFRADRRNAARENEAAALERSLTRLNGNLGSLLSTIERADVVPTSQVVQAVGAVERELNVTLAEWQALRR